MTHKNINQLIKNDASFFLFINIYIIPIINKVEYDILVEIEFYRMNGWSYNRIANYLNDKGIKSKNGSDWYSSSIRSVLNNGVLKLGD